MQTLSALVKFLRFVLDQQRKGLPTMEDLQSALGAGQQDLYNHYLTLETGRKGNEPGTGVGGYGASRITLNALRPFRAIFRPEGLSSSGTFPLPGDMGFFLGLFKSQSGKLLPVREALTDEIHDALKSRLYPVASNPVFTTDGNVIQQYPQAQYATELHYLKRPGEVVIKWTANGTEEVVNDSDPTNVPPLFAPEYWTELATRALVYLGVSLSDAEVYTMAKQQEA